MSQVLVAALQMGPAPWSGAEQHSDWRSAAARHVHGTEAGRRQLFRPFCRRLKTLVFKFGMGPFRRRAFAALGWKHKLFRNNNLVAFNGGTERASRDVAW